MQKIKQEIDDNLNLLKFTESQGSLKIRSGSPPKAYNNEGTSSAADNTRSKKSLAGKFKIIGHNSNKFKSSFRESKKSEFNLK